MEFNIFPQTNALCGCCVHATRHVGCSNVVMLDAPSRKSQADFVLKQLIIQTSCSVSKCAEQTVVLGTLDQMFIGVRILTLRSFQLSSAIGTLNQMFI